MLRQSVRIFSFVHVTILLIYVPVTVFSNWKQETHKLPRNEIDCKHLPDSQSNMTEIHAALLKYNINTAWLNIRRVRGEWQWLDGSEAGHLTGPPGRHSARHHAGCALLHAWDKRIYSFQCHLPGVTAICQAKDCKVCRDQGRQKPLCQHTGEYCHYLVNATSWYHARSLCAEYEDSSLALLSRQSLRSRVYKALVNSEVYTKYGNYFWVGLHQEDWKDDNGKGKSISSSRFEVVENAFRSPRGQCLVVKVHQNKLVWSVVHCSEKHHVLCRKESNQDNGISPSATPVPSAKTSQEEVNKLAVPQEVSSSAYGRIPDPGILAMVIFIYLSCSGALK